MRNCEEEFQLEVGNSREHKKACVSYPGLLFVGGHLETTVKPCVLDALYSLRFQFVKTQACGTTSLGLIHYSDYGLSLSLLCLFIV